MLDVPDTVEPLSEDWVRPLTRRDRRIDLWTAVLLLVGAGAAAPLFIPSGLPAPSLWFTAVWALGLTVPLAMRRRYPSGCLIGVVAAFVAGQAGGISENLVSQIAPFLAVYSAGAWARHRRRSIVVRIVAVLALLGWLVLGLVRSDGQSSGPYVGLGAGPLITLTVLVNLLYLGGAVVFGEAARVSARRLAALEVRTDELEDERHRTALQATALERVRIARELHDVVAHHVSVIGIQAGAARRTLQGAPDRAAAALASVEENARTAVLELGQVVATLRLADHGAEPVPSEGESTRGVDQIPSLIQQSEQAGIPTVLRVEGRAASLAPTAGHTLYRVTQEALTNVRKHAGPGVRVTVELRYFSDAAELEITDLGGGGDPGGPAGFGQVGMRERVSAVGGTLKTGPSAGGYTVWVRLPVRAVAP